MPPSSIPTGLSRVSDLAAFNTPTQLPKVFLLALLLVGCIRWTIHQYSKRRSREVVASPTSQEKVQHIGVLQEEPSSRCPVRHEQEHVPPTNTPIYPWVAPPQPLPGPYDPRLYPLPTIRRHSYPEPAHADATNADLTSMSYTRCVSSNNITNRSFTVEGTITTTKSPSGWRRNQWVVTG